MTSEAVAGVLNDARELGARTVCFSGGGEPLIWNGDLAHAMQAARSFATVTLTTSGDQLWDREQGELSTLARAVLGHCDTVLLNVPGISDDSLRRQIAGGPSWRDIRGLLEALVASRARYSSYRIFCVVVANMDNINELAEIDRRFTDLGVDDIYYKQFKVYESRSPARRVAPLDMASRLKPNLSDRASDGLKRFLSSVEEANQPHVQCWVNRLGFGAIVDPCGEVYLCTPTVGQQEFSIGNVRSSFRELWCSESRARALRSLSERSAAGGCPSECRFHAHNREWNARIMGTPGASALQSNAGIDNGLSDPRIQRGERKS